MKDDAPTRVRHATLTLERAYPATPERLFQALADPAERMKWDTPGEDWAMTELEQDARTGGEERYRFGPPGGPSFTGRSLYAQVLPARRLVTAGMMKVHDEPVSASVVTYEILPDPMGVRLVVTDQTAYFDDDDGPEDRKDGWGAMLDQLGAHIA